MPADIPVAIPDDEPIATAVPPLAQVPPGEPSLNVVVLPAQTLSVPVIADGRGLTVTVFAA